MVLFEKSEWLGGKAAEPIFRAQGLDEALGMSGILYAETINAEKIVIFATQVEGFQLAADAAEKAAEAVGIDDCDRKKVLSEVQTTASTWKAGKVVPLLLGEAS